MKFTKKQPTTGSFVAVWQQGNNVWSDTYRYSDQYGLTIWYEEELRWVRAVWQLPWIDNECKYVIPTKQHGESK